MQTLLIGILRGYKLAISPWLPSACRFTPTCSEYMAESIQVHGAARGLWLGLKRLGKCHPFHRGGYDPVPSTPGADNSTGTKPIHSAVSFREL